YVLCGDFSFEDIYDSAKERIESDSAVTDTKEIIDFFGNSQMKSSGLSDEYWEGYEDILRRYVPSDEENVQETLAEAREYPTFLHTLCLDNEDFKKLAAAGGADLSIVNDESAPAVLLYRKVELSTDNLIFGSKKPDYHFIEVQNAFRYQVGETFPLVLYLPDAEEVNYPLTVAGFLDEAALAPYFTFHGENPLAIINKAAADGITQMYEDADREYSLYDKLLLFQVKDGEGDTLLRELSQRKEQNEEHINVMSFDMLNTGGFEHTIVAIIRILAYCFTALISTVCLLNLWHSVKGRAMERRREIAMLRSMGMTNRQLRRMLAAENMLMTATGLLIAAALSSAFMLFLNRVMMERFGRMTLPVPYGWIAGMALAACIVMALMTLVCYRYSGKESIVEDIRNETV
ncbi:MAG: ABC transporter permease, partial [Clostridia bacterium]|nr:ABC transporter permease [Clostridia bacterium]